MAFIKGEFPLGFYRRQSLSFSALDLIDATKLAYGVIQVESGFAGNPTYFYLDSFSSHFIRCFIFCIASE
jgi:hypothetical protein